MKYLILLICFSYTVLNAQTKIGFVNITRLLDTMPSRNAALAELDQFQKSGLKELREKDSLLNAMYENISNICFSSSLMVKEAEQIMQEKYQKFQRRQEELDSELLYLSDSISAPIQERIKLAISIVAERENYSGIADQTTFYYYDKTLDCTDEVIIALMKLEVQVKL